MACIAVVENDGGWRKEIASIIRDEFKSSDVIEDLTDSWESDAASEVIRSARFALVDLELGAAKRGKVRDHLGKDAVLPRFRALARWTPIVLMSQYISKDQFLLSRLTSTEFDAVIDKDFFTDSRTNQKEWEGFCQRIALKRIGVLTGRSIFKLDELLAGSTTIDYGLGVKNAVEQVCPEPLFQELIRLMGFPAESVMIDDIVQGFSGVVVLRLTCNHHGRSTKWLLKCGSSIKKIDAECVSHDRMFREGFTRSMSVPLYRHAPVCWKGVGGIAYEFEEGTRTLLEIAQEAGVDEALRIASGALRRLYEGGQRQSIVPRSVLKGIPAEVSGCAGIQYGAVVAPLLAGAAAVGVDHTKEVIVSRQHGDLHARNVLVKGDVPVLIDFAHYVSAEDRGVPLIDVAKLVVDLTAFASPTWSIAQVLDGSVLDIPSVRRLADDARLLKAVDADDDERSLFRAAACCFVSRYCGYDDVSHAIRAQFRTALAAA